MVPLKDDLPTHCFPVLTLAIIVINTLVWLMGFQMAQIQAPAGHPNMLIGKHDVWVYEYGTIPCELFNQCTNQPGKIVLGAPGFMADNPPTVQIDVPDQPPWLTLLSSAFLHGNWLHLAGNMLFFWVYGNNVEDAMPRWLFGSFYLLGGLVAALAQSVVNIGSEVPQIGASGAIAAVIGGYLLLYPKARIFTIVPPLFFIWLPAWLVAGLWGVGQAWATTQSVFAPAGNDVGGGIAYMAHFAGFAFGLLVIRRIATPSAAYRELYERGREHWRNDWD